MFSRLLRTSLVKQPSRPVSSAPPLQTASFATSGKKGILERLEESVVVGDGGFVFALEKRGYVKAGPWTPEATVEFPEAVKQLHTEFARAGSDVMQTFTFYASEDKLENRGNYAAQAYGTREINDSACRIAREVADKYDALVAGGICQTPTYLTQAPKSAVQAEFRKQCEVFKANNVDFMIVEYYEHVEECVWAIEAVQDCMPGAPIAATLCIAPEGDLHGKSAGDCACEMAETGCEIIGLNCHFDPFVTLKGMEKMKVALEKNGFGDRHLMAQPLAYMTPDASKQGFIDLPEFPFALEPRVCTRWEIQRYAREAYEMGIRYIGGCCGFEAHHIRAVCEELEQERGRVGESSKKHERWGGGLMMHTKPWVRARANKEYWSTLNPSSGRPHSASMSAPDAWGVTQGDVELHQTKERETAVRQAV